MFFFQIFFVFKSDFDATENKSHNFQNPDNSPD